jgi:hypothetical protein
MSEGSNPASGGLSVTAGVALLRARFVQLSAEQQAEAVALFSELLLEGARRNAGGFGRSAPGAAGPKSRRAVAASEPDRGRRAA